MTYLHIHAQGLLKRTIGERRSDRATAENVHDALRACGLCAAAQAMNHLQVDFAVAVRILTALACQHRHMDAVASHASRHAAQPRHADSTDFFAVPG